MIDIYNKALSESKFYINSNTSPYNDSILEITIIDNKPSITRHCNNSFKDRERIVLSFIIKTCSISKRKINVICRIGLHDRYFEDFGIMVFSRDINNKNTLIPDIYAMTQYSNSLNINDRNPFKNKANKAAFIGSTTGNENPALNDRLLLCDWANKNNNNNKINAYISNICQISPEKISEVFPNYKDFLYRFIDFNNLLVYKFIISIDGNTTAWDRIPRIFASNSICFKKKSSNINWYYNFMLPGVHYIEYDKNEDLISLIDKYSSPEEEPMCNKIIENSHKFVNDYLFINSHLIYMENLLYILSNNK